MVTGTQGLADRENEPSGLEAERAAVYVLFAGFKSPVPRTVPPRYPLQFNENFDEVFVKTI